MTTLPAPKKPRYFDPVTGDPLTFGEHISWLAQGIIRRWIFLMIITAITAACWTYVAVRIGFSLRSGALALLTWWNLAASYLALLIEGTVGIAMFSQTRRDAVKIRMIEAMERRTTRRLDLICEHLGIEVPEE